MTTVASYLVEQLKAHGIQTVYGLPGGENVEVLEAIRQQGLDFVLVRNESSACFMAATCARITGRIGAALTTLGPGAANAYAGLAHAWLDRAPVLLITAAPDPRLVGTHTHQVIDLQTSFRPITKFTAELSADSAAATIQYALTAAISDRPGPVHLGIHNRIALQPIGQKPPVPPIASKTSSENTDSSAIKALLSDKKKPIILVGLGLEPEKPYADIRRLAESLNAPLIDTPKSKGALSAEHPLFGGTLGLTAYDPAYRLLNESDCIIAIGFDAVELVKPWDQPQELIWIANWANQDPHLPCVLEYVGHIGKLLQQLGDVRTQRDASWGAARVRRFRQQQARELPAAQPNRLLPQTLLAALRKHLPDKVTLTTDVGSHKIFTALHWEARQANSYFVSNGLSVMGFGLSSAIAAAQHTAQPVICITGDAGLAMVMGELGLLSELDLPVMVVVMNDSALDLIRSAQQRQNYAVYGTEFRNPNYAQIAKAYALDYRRAETAAGCAEAIQHALALGKPTLIDAMIDPIGYPTTIRDA